MQKIDLTLHHEYIIIRLKKGVSNGRKLYQELKDQGFNGSYSTFYRYLKEELGNYWKESSQKKSKFHRKKSTISFTRYKTAIRFETEPGEQAQVDWGHFGEITLNGKIEKLYCFVFILSYSRTIYIELTTTQKLPVFEKCHINAFKALGIPKGIVYDNTKTVILSREKMPDGSKRVYYNLAFQDFAKYYGFKIIDSPPYWPRNKGKVEASVKYVRNNFMQGKTFIKNISSLEELNREAAGWSDKIANSRIHATTKEIPYARWDEEKKHLLFPNELPDYQVAPFFNRYSTKDQQVPYRQNFYSVPKEFAWRKVSIREVNNQGNTFIHIYHKGKLIAQHKLFTGNGRSIEDPKHFQSTTESIKNMTTNSKESLLWRNFPEVDVRPFSYYDKVILKDYEQES